MADIYCDYSACIYYLPEKKMCGADAIRIITNTNGVPQCSLDDTEFLPKEEEDELELKE